MKHLKQNNKLFVILFSFFYLSCNNERNFKYYKKVLEHNQGSIEFKLPVKFDTVYQWYEQTDSKCTDHFKFRIANSKYSLPRETGFFYNFKIDSLYQITIKEFNLGCNEPLGIETKKKSFKELDSHFEKYVNSVASNYGSKASIVDFNLDSIKLDKRSFYMSEYQINTSFQIEYKIIYNTYINNQPLEIEGKCLASNCEDFKEYFKNAMQTVIIKTH